MNEPVVVTPAEELRVAVALLRNPCNCLPNKDPLADLLDAIADDMEEHGAVEGSASKAVHPVTVLGLGAPDRPWTAALAVARAQPGQARMLTADPEPAAVTG